MNNFLGRNIHCGVGAVARTEESVNLRKGSKTTKLFSKIKIPIYLIHIHRQAAPFAARNRDYPVVYAHSIHAYEVYACGGALPVRCTPMRCTPVRCSFMRYTPMRWTPVRYT